MRPGGATFLYTTVQCSRPSSHGQSIRSFFDSGNTSLFYFLYTKNVPDNGRKSRFTLRFELMVVFNEKFDGPRAMKMLGGCSGVAALGSLLSLSLAAILFSKSIHFRSVLYKAYKQGVVCH